MGALLGILYLLICIVITIFVLIMIWRFVRAHELIAESMSELASKSISKEIKEITSARSDDAHI